MNSFPKRILIHRMYLFIEPFSLPITTMIWQFLNSWTKNVIFGMLAAILVNMATE